MARIYIGRGSTGIRQLRTPRRPQADHPGTARTITRLFKMFPGTKRCACRVAQPPERRAGVRGWRGRRHPLPRDGVRARPGPARAPREGRQCRDADPARARADRGRGCGRRSQPRTRAARQRRDAARHRPPRRVAVEHHDRLRRFGEAARLRHREGDAAIGRDPVGHHQGQVRVHGAGAVPRSRRRSPQRRVLARHHPLRDLDAASLLSRRQRLRHDAPHRHGRRRATHAPGPGLSAGARGDRHEGARGGSGAALSECRSPARGDRELRDVGTDVAVDDRASVASCATCSARSRSHWLGTPQKQPPITKENTISSTDGRSDVVKNPRPQTDDAPVHNNSDARRADSPMPCPTAKRRVPRQRRRRGQDDPRSATRPHRSRARRAAATGARVEREVVSVHAAADGVERDVAARRGDSPDPCDAPEGRDTGAWRAEPAAAQPADSATGRASDAAAGPLRAGPADLGNGARTSRDREHPSRDTRAAAR